MNPVTNYWIFGITFAFAAAVQPGPLQTFLITQTIKNGWRKTWPAAFAPVISDGPILLLVLLILTKIPADFITFLRIAGGLFLLFLAFKAFQSWRNFQVESFLLDKPGQQTLMNAVVVNLLNPNPYLGWSLVMGPMLLDVWQRDVLRGVGFILSFYLTMIIMLTAIILLFGMARRFGPAVSRVLVGLSALALFGFAVYQLWLGTMSIAE